MPVFVPLHLGETQHCILTLGAVIMSLLAIVGTASHRTKLSGSVLFKAGCHDRVQLLVLSTVGHHFVGVGAVVVALQAVEMAAGLLRVTGYRHWNN